MVTQWVTCQLGSSWKPHLCTSKHTECLDWCTECKMSMPGELWPWQKGCMLVSLWIRKIPLQPLRGDCSYELLHFIAAMKEQECSILVQTWQHYACNVSRHAHCKPCVERKLLCKISSPDTRTLSTGMYRTLWAAKCATFERRSFILRPFRFGQVPLHVLCGLVQADSR